MMPEDNTRLAFGAVIREARRQRGWSQTDLGEHSGVSRPTVARVEADRDVSTATLTKIAEALGLSLELTGKGKWHVEQAAHEAGEENFVLPDLDTREFPS